jgi:hypothetical protein
MTSFSTNPFRRKIAGCLIGLLSGVACATSAPDAAPSSSSSNVEISYLDFKDTGINLCRFLSPLNAVWVDSEHILVQGATNVKAYPNDACDDGWQFSDVWSYNPVTNSAELVAHESELNSSIKFSPAAATLYHGRQKTFSFLNFEKGAYQSVPVAVEQSTLVSKGFRLSGGKPLLDTGFTYRDKQRNAPDSITIVWPDNSRRETSLAPSPGVTLSSKYVSEEKREAYLNGYIGRGVQGLVNYKVSLVTGAVTPIEDYPVTLVLASGTMYVSGLSYQAWPYRKGFLIQTYAIPKHDSGLYVMPDAKNPTRLIKLTDEDTIFFRFLGPHDCELFTAKEKVSVGLNGLTRYQRLYYTNFCDKTFN